MEQISLTRLKLTFSPVSNYLGTNLWDDGEIHPLLSSSRLYMIARRAILLFEKLRLDQERGVVCFNLRCGQVYQQGLEWSCLKLIEKHLLSECVFEGGDNHFKFLKSVNGNKPVVIGWFTPDKLLWLHSCGLTEIVGIKSIRPFWNFQLLYVGISKKEDSFSRLFKRAHNARTAILSTVDPVVPGARITDEVTLLFFDINPIEARIIGDNSGSCPPQVEKEAFIADAEKALVHVLKPKFNRELYKNYPRGNDGLYSNSDYIRYGYVIDELLSVQTPTECLRGGHLFGLNRTEQPDRIMVDRKKYSVSIRRAKPDDSVQKPKRHINFVGGNNNLQKCVQLCVKVCLTVLSRIFFKNRAH